jgi:hypothetical protein
MHDSNKGEAPRPMTHAQRIADLQMRLGNAEMILSRVMAALELEAGISIEGPPQPSSARPY